ncbi:MAG TPA: carbamoyl phosphate synthase small subunit, partial [Gemmatimonadales bacterium]
MLLEDGAWFLGTTRRPFSATPGEVVFTTNLTGYQEVFTDPSYLGQIVVMTAPLIGNYGVNPDDVESGKPQVTGVVVRELSAHHSSWRATGSLDAWLGERGIPLIDGIDTRRLTRHLRSRGAMRGILAGGDMPTDDVRKLLDASPRMEGLDLASRATVQAECAVGDPKAKRHVVAYDFGMKSNILRLLQAAGCRITVVPASTTAGRVRELKPDGLFLSNGPGDPAAVQYVLPHLRDLTKSGLPTFGICLG